MPLTELIIDGFKSFADKTTIHFDQGITGIVGPNGSGKSNITEAIRWAMGESRAKSLRGSSMKDVIFAGSELRKPLNRAEVTLVFDNHNHELKFDNEKVAVTRRILHSGDSDYLINNQSVRLKDIRTLFLDSGISQNSLAIISQGRVDQILNSRPEERRIIFEEAAGVLHFKEQKEIAQNELVKTNDNLIRINDIVKELEKRIEPLHEQSSLAKEYKFQKKQLDQKLKTLLAFEIETLNKKRKQIQSKADKNQVLLERLDSEFADSQEAVASKKEEYQLLNEKREQTQNELLKITNQVSKSNADLQISEQSKQYDEATKNEYQTQLEDLEVQIKTLTAELARFDEEKDNLTASQSKLKEKRNDLVAQLHEDPNELDQKLEEMRNSYIQLLQDQTTNNNQLVYLKAELKKATNDQSSQDSAVTKQYEEANKQLAKLKETGQKLNTQKNEAESQLTSLKKRHADLEEQITTLRQLVNNERNDLQKINARYEALSSIQKRHEGYYLGVRSVLNHVDNYPGVIGVIGELLTFSSNLEAAITTALGSGVQNLLTDTRISARNAINQLKHAHAGRATFLPLDGLRQHSIPSSTVTILKSFDGFKGIASELVESKTDVDITAAINYLLGSVIVVDNIDTALAISKRVNRYRIVTLEGDVISPGGSMTGGMRNQQNNSPLQTITEINKLEEQIAKIKKQFTSDNHGLQDLLEDELALQKEIDKHNEQIQNLSQKLNEAAISYQNEEKEVKRLADANALFDIKSKERVQSIKKLEQDIELAENKRESLTLDGKKQENAIAELRTRIKNFSVLNKEVQAKISELDPEIAVFSNKLENLLAQQEDKSLQLQNSKDQLQNLTKKLAALGQDRELSLKKRKDLRGQLESLSEQKEDLQKTLQNISSKLGQVNAQINQLDQIASRNYDLRKDAAVEQEEFSVKLAKLNTEIDQRLETLSTDYSMTYEAAINQADVENTEKIRNELKKSVKLHRMSIADIGPVNLDSIEEYDEVKERYDFLSGQQDDLLKAREDLKNSMTELDDEVKTRFSETFTKVADGFTKIFPVVFGGGNAKLVLTDPDDMLKTGVEIIAQPPGKKLQHLNLLSGGERALTAITLLFAMLQINPVPFCVLDEVEAALDDANVTRFAQFLQKYDMHTQFIVITHRRGTMQQADQLYGVVMQESGVSQVLSVSLKEIKDEVN